jgi:predicted negative regulator of RcsB-dependent stress response
MTNADAPKQGSTEGLGFFEILTWLEVNKKRLIIGAVVALVVGFGIYVYQWASDQKESKAMAALLELRQPLGSTNAPATTPAQYLKIAADYPGTSAAEQAVILAAGAAFDQNNYSEAQAQFQSYLTKYGNNGTWAGVAELGIAAALEAQNKKDEALAAYQKLTSGRSNDPVVPQAKLALARLYEARNQPDKAYAIYDELSKPTSPNSATSEAFVRKTQILKKHPELAATNAPAVTPAVMKPVTNAPVTAKRATNAPAK